MRVGLVGTGMLGEAVGIRLIECGHDIMAFNRTESKTKKLKSAGAVICDTARDVAAQCNLLITCVTDADAVRDTVFGNDGISQGAHDSLIVGDMSTIEPADSVEISRRLHTECGVRMIGIPVMGGPDAAAAGSLVVIADGDKRAYDMCKQVLQDIAQNVHYVGDSGTAHTIKLAMNLQIASLAVSISEGIEIVRRNSVDPEAFLEVLNSTYFSTGMSQKKAHRMVRGEYPPTFLLRNLKKDLKTITSHAKRCGVELRFASNIESMYKDAVDAGHGELDYTGILRYIQGMRK